MKLLVGVSLLLFSQPLLGADYNAGILPYHTSETGIQVLLGLDEERGYWTDFVGRNNGGESEVDVATREFTEEARGAYSSPEILRRLSETEAIDVGGGVKVYPLEVSFVAAEELADLPKVCDYEKSRYCWVGLDELLLSIDEAASKEDLGKAEVPKRCGGEKLRLWDVFSPNLIKGKPLRSFLDGLRESGLEPEEDIEGLEASAPPKDGGDDPPRSKILWMWIFLAVVIAISVGIRRRKRKI